MKNQLQRLTCLIIAVGVSGGAAVSSHAQKPMEPIAQREFGQTKTGDKISVYTLHNAKGCEAQIINYGGTVVSLKMPDRTGQFADVVLGYDTVAGYENATFYFGALIGRYGNRIALGRFTLDGKQYQLATNNSPNHLHGGVKGFDKVVWDAKPMDGAEGQALELRYVSKDGEEGYPGKLTVTATYTLTNQNELKIVQRAVTDKDTIINLTHHSYFNLAGKGDILGHLVTIHADRFTPMDKGSIPTGELKPVEGTPFDFRQPTAIGARIKQDDQQLKFGQGYDHNFVINAGTTPDAKTKVLAEVYEPGSGRTMEVISTEPGLQFYTGNFLDGSNPGKGGATYQIHAGFCMEPQHFPDSPNKPNFPPVVLKAGQTFENTIIYRFGTK